MAFHFFTGSCSCVPKSSTTVLHSVYSFRRTSPLPVPSSTPDSQHVQHVDKTPMADWTLTVSESSNGRDTKVFSGLRDSTPTDGLLTLAPPFSRRQSRGRPLSPLSLLYRQEVFFSSFYYVCLGGSVFVLNQLAQSSTGELPETCVALTNTAKSSMLVHFHSLMKKK